MSYTKGLVSVVIPCYNQGKYLYHVTDSVLNQTYDKVEIIVVNDGSTEEYTIKVLKAFERPNTRVLNTKNQGLSMARNNGIAAAKGEFIYHLTVMMQSCLITWRNYSPTSIKNLTLQGCTPTSRYLEIEMKQSNSNR